MKERNKKSDSKILPVKKDNSRKFETMSQAQNRHGKGRQRNGSDGGVQVQANNH
jgi:hypothetical protein